MFSRTAVLSNLQVALNMLPLARLVCQVAIRTNIHVLTCKVV